MGGICLCWVLLQGRPWVFGVSLLAVGLFAAGLRVGTPVARCASPCAALRSCLDMGSLQQSGSQPLTVRAGALSFWGAAS